MARNKVGFDEAAINRMLKKLSTLPDKINRKAVNNIAKAALRPVKNSAKSDVLSESRGGQFSLAYQVAMGIKVFGSKNGHPPGAYVRVKGKPVKMNQGTPGAKDWNAGGSAKLLAEGSHKTTNRSHKSGKRTGTTKGKGAGNFILDNALKHEAFISSHFEKAMIKEMDKAKKKIGFGAR